MAGDNLNVWFDPEGDHLEIVFDQKAGYFEDTPIENVMRKRDAEGNLLAISIFNLSSFARAGSTPNYGSWSVFNLDVDDGETFDVEVALGYQRLGEAEAETDPESPMVSYTDPDARARCSIFFHAREPVPRASRLVVVERTVEIIHKPLSLPVVSWDEDLMSSVSLTSLCRDQLALSLRLFQPESFFMFARGRRDEGRARAYLALSARRPGALTPYVLKGRQVARFREFARRLWEFHRDRNRYRLFRWDPLGILLAAEADGSSFLKRVARLMIATDLFERANNDPAVSGDLRLLWLVMAAEALFADDDKSELSYRLANRIAFLNGGTVDEVKQHGVLVRSLYEARSKLMHGTPYVAKPSKRLSELVGEAGFIRIPPDHLFALSNLVRASLLYFIALQDQSRSDVLDILDRSVFDPSEVTGLRRKANEYWGLSDHADEMLCSGRWQS
jgi:hypothetical protein